MHRNGFCQTSDQTLTGYSTSKPVGHLPDIRHKKDTWRRPIGKCPGEWLRAEVSHERIVGRGSSHVHAVAIRLYSALLPFFAILPPHCAEETSQLLSRRSHTTVVGTVSSVF